MGIQCDRAGIDGRYERSIRIHSADRDRDHSADRDRSAECDGPRLHAPAAQLHQAPPLAHAGDRATAAANLRRLVGARISDRRAHGLHVDCNDVGRRQSRGPAGGRTARGRVWRLARDQRLVAPAHVELERAHRAVDGHVLQHHFAARPPPRRFAPVRARSRVAGCRAAAAQVAAQSALPVQLPEQRARADRGRSSRARRRR